GFEYLYFKKGMKKPQIIVHEEKLYALNTNHIDEYADSVSELCKESAKIISSKFSNISLCMTGGLDSRVVLSSYLSSGCSPSLLYGEGNSGLTNTKKKDLEIVEIIESKLGLKLDKMDWSTNEWFIKHWEPLTRKIGYLGWIYSGIPNVHNELENIDGNTLVDFGYFGEPFRDIEVLMEFEKDNYSLSDFLDKMYIKEEVKSYLPPNDYVDFRNRLYKKAEIICI
uniref:hypothetical protein n=3 Tax=Vibrio TaxID=662 RepID=UPI000A4C8EA6